eukprot:TRINITY_DN24492_c0_g1_i1.p1 TRINITY_DN24492_c0_g1~~TRINITY_DN24492_c0_g1_i1.p1  ORF type:complete len:474 (+),score=105.10 TRINITY_DN24492_c0_g1_i1:122-1423(+)
MAAEAARWNVVYTGPIQAKNGVRDVNVSKPISSVQLLSVTILQLRMALAEFAAEQQLFREGFETSNLPSPLQSPRRAAMCKAKWLTTPFCKQHKAIPRFELTLLYALNSLNRRGYDYGSSIGITGGELLRFDSLKLARQAMLYTSNFGLEQLRQVYETMQYRMTPALATLFQTQPQTQCHIEVLVNGTVLRPRWSYTTTILAKFGGNVTFHTFEPAQLPNLHTYPHFHPWARHADISLLAADGRIKANQQPSARSRFASRDAVLVVPPGYAWAAAVHDIAAIFTCQHDDELPKPLAKALEVDVPFLAHSSFDAAQIKALFTAIVNILIKDIRVSPSGLLRSFYTHHLAPLQPDVQGGQASVQTVHACSKNATKLTAAKRTAAKIAAIAVAKELRNLPTSTHRSAIMDFAFRSIEAKLGLYNVFSIFDSCFASN